MAYCFLPFFLKEIENKKGVVNECYFAVNVKVAGSIPACRSNPIVAQLVEQEHRKVHFTCCLLPFFKN